MGEQRWKIVSIAPIIALKRMRMIRQSGGVLLWEKMPSEKKTAHAVRVRMGQYETEENRSLVFLAKQATFRQIVKNVTSVRINTLYLSIVTV